MPYYFTLPLFTDMTAAQMAVLDQTEPVAISGGPGTGKSVVSLWRHIRNHATDLKTSILLTYTKTLETYLAQCASTENKSAGRAVDRTYLWKCAPYDEIIIDEAQDVTEVHYQGLLPFAKSISYGADDQQILYPERSTTQAQLATLFPNNHLYELDTNFRNSFEIMEFVQAALPNRLISHVMMDSLKRNKKSGILPKCLVTNLDNNKQQKAILDIIAEFQSGTHNIGILLPLQKHVDSMYNFLQEQKVNCTKYFHDGEELGIIENVHVTTFKSAKGIEFDTVILPDFGSWKRNIDNLRVVEENDYYVAFTRAKRNLYLISESNKIGVNIDTFETIIL